MGIATGAAAAHGAVGLTAVPSVGLTKRWNVGGADGLMIGGPGAAAAAAAGAGGGQGQGAGAAKHGPGGGALGRGAAPGLGIGA